MPDYQSVSLRVGLRERLDDMKQSDDETYSDVIERAISNQKITHDEVEQHLGAMAAWQVQQGALIARIAREVGLSDGEIPEELRKRGDMDDPTEYASEILSDHMSARNRDTSDYVEESENNADVWEDSPFDPTEDN